MKNLIDIIEGLKIGSKTKINKYSCRPKDKDELRKIIKERLKQDKNTNLNDIDVSNIKDMQLLFNELDPHNIDISEWDVSNVEDMSGMFFDCRNLDCDLSKWEVSKVKDMNYMFTGCTSLKNKPSWYKENLTDIIESLKINSKTKVNKYSCKPKDLDELWKIVEEYLKKDKNANLNDIDVSNITDMSYLFDGLDPHNIDISEWDVSKVKDMYNMFSYCKNFNCDLSNWDVSNVKDMSWMFYDCNKFNCDLSKWNVSKVTNINNMFHGCTSLKNKPSWYKK